MVKSNIKPEESGRVLLFVGALIEVRDNIPNFNVVQGKVVLRTMSHTNSAC